MEAQGVFRPSFVPRHTGSGPATIGRMNKAQFLIALAALALQFDGSAVISGQPPSPSAPQLVILDTDIGDDIDDAFALALILRSPELHLLGVETAFGDTELRARLVDRYLAAVGRSDVPVLAGSSGPQTSHFSQAAYARQWPERKACEWASTFCLGKSAPIRDQITLIAIGPLSNVGAAIARDPATFKKLKRVVIMGGSVYRGYDAGNGDKNTPPSPEWNILCDPAGSHGALWFRRAGLRHAARLNPDPPGKPNAWGRSSLTARRSQTN